MRPGYSDLIAFLMTLLSEYLARSCDVNNRHRSAHHCWFRSYLHSLPICLDRPAPTHNVSPAMQVQHLANLLHFKVSKSISQARRSWQRQRQASRAKRAQKQSSKHGQGHHGLHLHLPWRRHRESNADQICRWHLLSMHKLPERAETQMPGLPARTPRPSHTIVQFQWVVLRLRPPRRTDGSICLWAQLTQALDSDAEFCSWLQLRVEAHRQAL